MAVALVKAVAGESPDAGATVAVADIRAELVAVQRYLMQCQRRVSLLHESDLVFLDDQKSMTDNHTSGGSL